MIHRISDKLGVASIYEVAIGDYGFANVVISLLDIPDNDTADPKAIEHPGFVAQAEKML